MSNLNKCIKGWQILLTENDKYDTPTKENHIGEERKRKQTLFNQCSEQRNTAETYSVRKI